MVKHIDFCFISKVKSFSHMHSSQEIFKTLPGRAVCVNAAVWNSWTGHCANFSLATACVKVQVMSDWACMNRAGLTQKVDSSEYKC